MSFTTDNYEDYINNIDKTPLSRDEEIKLFIEKDAGSIEARNKLINKNLIMVVEIASIYTDYNIDMMDIIQYGNIGLIKAIDTYDYRKSDNLRNYAYHKIRLEIIRGLEKTDRPIKIPSDTYHEVVKYKRFKKYLKSKLENDLTVGDLSKYYSIEEIIKLEKLLKQVTSLDKITINNINEDIIQLKCDLSRAIDKAKLTSLELYSLTHKYELFENDKKTLAEMSIETGISAGTIRSSYEKAIKKLRKTKCAKILKDYYY